MIFRGVSALLNMMFGCTHSNYSFPQSPKDRGHCPAAGPTGVYVVCLGCGREFPYDWREMKVITAPSHSAEPRAAEAVESLANKAA